MLKRMVICIALVLIVPQIAVAETRIPESSEIRFEIRRDGQAFGSHVLRFSQNDDGQRIVQIDIKMKYCLGPICLFRYDHDNRVVRDDGRVVEFAARTDDDGDRYEVNARWGAEEVTITVNGETRTAPASALPTTYWHEDMLKSDKLINTQKGTVQDIEILKQARDTSYMVDGERRDARHYVIKTDRRVDVWYDAATGQWIGLKFPAREATISYHRQSAINQ